MSHTCFRCGYFIPQGYTACPRCGAYVYTQNPPQAYPISPPPPPATVWRPSLIFQIKEALTTLFLRSPRIIKPSPTVYKRLPSPNVVKSLAIAAALMFIAGISLVHGGQWLVHIGTLIAGGVAPVMLVLLLFALDLHEHEPIQILLFLVAWGVMSTFVVILFHTIIPIFRGAPAWIAGPIPEEPAKIAGVYILASSVKYRDEFNDHLDGLVWGAAAGAGFAISENLAYILKLTTPGLFFGAAMPFEQAVLIRSMTGMMHVIATALVGRWLGLMKARFGTLKARDLIPGLLVGILFHMLWNASPYIILNVLLLLAGLFILFKYVKEALDDEKMWGWRMGYAPVEK